MNIQNAVITAVRAITKNRIRAALTSVGIIIGVSSVIMMIGIGSSASEAILKQIKTFGYNAVAVEGDECRFQDRDLENIKNIFGDVDYISPLGPCGARLVKNGKYSTESRVFGVDNDYLAIKQRKIVSGRKFTQQETSAGERVAVIGRTVIRELFHGADATGKKITIMNMPYTVVGELDSMGESISSDYDNDNEILIPYTTANRNFFQTSFFHDFVVSVSSENALDSTVEKLREYIRSRNHLSESQEDTFKIYTSREKMGMAKEISEAMTVLLAGIASISLIVGGIGIMNIMLVSVTERTREIGIRMAIGAKRKDILVQFLIESVTLSSGGGVAGILLGLIVYYIITIFAKWPFIFSPVSIVLSFSFAAFTGILFGFLPARKASRLKPIDALKFE